MSRKTLVQKCGLCESNLFKAELRGQLPKCANFSNIERSRKIKEDSVCVSPFLCEPFGEWHRLNLQTEEGKQFEGCLSLIWSPEIVPSFQRLSDSRGMKEWGSVKIFWMGYGPWNVFILNKIDTWCPKNMAHLKLENMRLANF